MIAAQLAEALGRPGLALLLGSAIGFERQWHQKMAGLRTNALVALGASGFVVFSGMVGEGDPTRIAAQVVTGIGFLGAGVILREGVNVHGLDTAATLWCSAMVGTFIGGGFWLPGISAAGFVVLTNLLLRPLLYRLNTRALMSSDVETHYTVEITCKGAEEAHMRSLLLHALSQAGARPEAHRQRRHPRHLQGGRDGAGRRRQVQRCRPRADRRAAQPRTACDRRDLAG
jgi:putative Mg2+ transporter-C (MgtC) family protein